MNLATLDDLMHCGWHVNTILRVTVDSMTVQLPPSPDATRCRLVTLFNNPADPVTYANFKEVCDLLRKLQRLNALSIAATSEKEKATAQDAITLNISLDPCNLAATPYAKSWTDDEYANAVVSCCTSLDKLLSFGAAGGSGYAPLSPTTRRTIVLKSDTPSETVYTPGVFSVYLHTRSLKDILFFLSQGVEVPLWDQDKVKTYHYQEKDGTWPAVDWRKCTQDLLSVHCIPWTPVRPLNAFVAVEYRGCWFYISDAIDDTAKTVHEHSLDRDPDLGQVCKDNFALLGLIYALKAGEVTITAPQAVIAQ
jgi:hypothetical protein